MEKKIVVPEGMLKTVENTCGLVAAFDEVLKVALRWLSENPIVPTVEDILAEANATRQCDAEMHVQWIAWWQRRMFLAASEPCDNPVVKGVVDRFRGITLSRAEADYIIENVNMVTHG